MRTHRLAPASMLAVAGFVLGGVAYGDDTRSRTPLLAAYTQECADCHVAYPPRLLPAASWHRLMSNPPRHFGTDASLPGPTLATLDAWLTANAARSGRRAQEPPDDRITRASWSVREHREVPQDA